jgi:hypothetical protein
MNGTVSTARQESNRRIRTLKQLRHSMAVITGLVIGAVGLIAAAPAAFAMRVSQPTEVAGSTPAVAVAHSGMLGWQITLIAVGAAIVSAFATAFLLRVGSGRRVGHAAS